MDIKKRNRPSSSSSTAPSTVSRPPDNDESMDILAKATKEILPEREDDNVAFAVGPTSPRVGPPSSKQSSQVSTSPWVAPTIERGTGPPYPVPHPPSHSSASFGPPYPASHLSAAQPTFHHQPGQSTTPLQPGQPPFNPFAWNLPMYAAQQGLGMQQTEGVHPTMTPSMAAPYGMFPYGMGVPWVIPAVQPPVQHPGTAAHQVRDQGSVDTNVVSTDVEAVSGEDDDSSSTISTPSGAPTATASAFRNPHRKDLGTPLSAKVLDWWKELRTNKLSAEDLKDEVQSQAVPADQTGHFEPPELPAGIKKVFKLANSSLVSGDDRLKSAHGHVLKSALPLLHLFDAMMDTECPDFVSKELIVEHLTSALILLGSASQSLATARQHLFDGIVDKRFEVLRKNSPSMNELFGSSILKDIEETEKANKLAAKVTKGASSTPKEKRFAPYRLAMSRSSARGRRGGGASRGTFRPFKRNGQSFKGSDDAKQRNFSIV